MARWYRNIYARFKGNPSEALHFFMRTVDSIHDLRGYGYAFRRWARRYERQGDRRKAAFYRKLGDDLLKVARGRELESKRR